MTIAEALPPDLAAVVARVPLLASAKTWTAVPLDGGMTNTNHLVTTDTGRYVVRIASDDPASLGIVRTRERAALAEATAAGIAPEVIAHLLPEGHLVTRYLPDTMPLSPATLRDRLVIEAVGRLFAQVHALEPIEGRFDPYADIDRWMQQLSGRGLPLASLLDPVLDAVRATGAARRTAALVTSHNDPYHLNLLDDGRRLWLIDWEYAGMNDPLYDLAGVARSLDAAGRDALLKAYGAAVDRSTRAALDDMVCVFLCWGITWSLHQADRHPERPDYPALAQELLHDARRELGLR